MVYRLMRRALLLIALFILTSSAALAHDDINDLRECAHCGMDRKAYGYSRMMVTYRDGGKVGVCSLHCAVTELDAHKGREVAFLQVADRDTREQIDANTAIWVMGGSKRGVMTQRPKWAFRTRQTAEKFIAASGGTIVSWVEVLSAARQDAAPKAR